MPEDSRFKHRSAGWPSAIKVNEMIVAIVRIYLEGKRVGYLVLGLAESAEAAHETAAALEEAKSLLLRR